MTLIWYVAMNVIIDNATVLYYCMYTVHTNSRHIVVATYNVGELFIKELTMPIVVMSTGQLGELRIIRGDLLNRK